MRFIRNGPSIPNELLEARDEGRVVFFCGAGVSKARAKMPDFFGLAESVIHELGVPSDSHAHRVLMRAIEDEDELELAGLISVDRVFSYLERDFTTADIQSAVSRCLSTKAGGDRSAHEILLRLARSPDQKTRIVTTNFDRLFEGEANCHRVYQAPRLPDLRRSEDVDGIVYLHGRVNENYSGASGDSFILSTSDFGHAYLSEGWATEFFREIIRRYVVVFLGYSASDPPVLYLLEGLRRTATSRNQIFAFQANDSDELLARWHHQGISVVPYACADGHSVLWETLELWADRADDPVSWRKSILDQAVEGPRQLEPYQRGQVAHIVSTYQGARAFADAQPAAEWLCVFDPSCRFENPGKLDPWNPDSQEVAPFDLYKLDSDRAQQQRADMSSSGRAIETKDAWDAFAQNRSDLRDLSPDHYAVAIGEGARKPPLLPNRLVVLGTWLAGVSDQKATLWWASRQRSLHPRCQQLIEWRLSDGQNAFDDDLRRAWKYIFESWAAVTLTERHDRHEWYSLKKEVDRDGWSSARIRWFRELSKPFLKIDHGILPRPVPPSLDEECRIGDMLRVRVECRTPPRELCVHDEWLPQVVREFRHNIEVSVRLHTEVEDFRHETLCPIVPEEGTSVSIYQRTHGLSGTVIAFAGLFERLIELDPALAKQEFSSWPSDDHSVFARLRVWACGKPMIAAKPHQLVSVIRGLKDDFFWNGYHQRDLLLVLAQRWSDLSSRDRRYLESRLLHGPAVLMGEDEASYSEHRAWHILQRLQWLRDRGCTFSFDFDTRVATLRAKAPKWKPENAADAVKSREIMTGRGVNDDNYAVLMHIPIASVLSRAKAISQQPKTSDFVERDPFRGLCVERPKRAYLALVRCQGQDDFPVWAWETFLRSESRKTDSVFFSATIATRLCRLRNEQLCRFLYTVASSFVTVSNAVSKEFPRCFDRMLQRIIDVVRDEPSSGQSAVASVNGEQDWSLVAECSPIGNVILSNFDDARIDADLPASAEPCLERISECLALPSVARHHAVTMVARRLEWLYRIDPEWSEKWLFSIVDEGDELTQTAMWAGFLSSDENISVELFEKLKPAILQIVRKDGSFRDKHADALANLMLYGWVKPSAVNETPCVSDSEFKDVLLHGGDKIRCQVIWQVGQEASCSQLSDGEMWYAKARKLFRDVWPRQISVKTPETTTALCELLLSDVDAFVELSELVTSLLSAVRDATGMYMFFRENTADVAERCPERFLQFLDTILPDDVMAWPYNCGELLDKIIAKDDSLIADSRMVCLRRKWSAR